MFFCFLFKLSKPISHNRSGNKMPKQLCRNVKNVL